MAAEKDTSWDDSEACSPELVQEAVIHKFRPPYRNISWNNFSWCWWLWDLPCHFLGYFLTVQSKEQPQLWKMVLRLSCPLGELPVVGQLSTRIMCIGKDIPGTVSCWQLGNVPEHAAKLNGSNTELDARLSKYANILALGLRLYKGPSVTFQLKENLCPGVFFFFFILYPTPWQTRSWECWTVCWHTTSWCWWKLLNGQH